jgi:hypothetical protein
MAATMDADVAANKPERAAHPDGRNATHTIVQERRNRHPCTGR